MRYVLTNAQMRAADGFTINELKVPSLTLMERAGAALAAEAERMCPAGGDVLCVCGGGNNGGVCLRAASFAKGNIGRDSVYGGKIFRRM